METNTKLFDQLDEVFGVNQQKHTPGEWIFGHWVRAKGQGDCPTEIRASGYPGGRLIASLNLDTSDKELSAERCMANAKLITAAPIMLEELKEQSCWLNEMLNSTPDNSEQNRHRRRLYIERIESIETAIQKATK